LTKFSVHFVEITSEKGFISKEANWWEGQGETNYHIAISEKRLLPIKHSFFYSLRMLSRVKVATSTLSAEQSLMQTTSVGLLDMYAFISMAVCVQFSS
jgi:hypothetical protein